KEERVGDGVEQVEEQVHHNRSTPSRLSIGREQLIGGLWGVGVRIEGKDRLLSRVAQSSSQLVGKVELEEQGERPTHCQGCQQDGPGRKTLEQREHRENLHKECKPPGAKRGGHTPAQWAGGQ